MTVVEVLEVAAGTRRQRAKSKSAKRAELVAPPAGDSHRYLALSSMTIRFIV